MKISRSFFLGLTSWQGIFVCVAAASDVLPPHNLHADPLFGRNNQRFHDSNRKDVSKLTNLESVVQRNRKIVTDEIRNIEHFRDIIAHTLPSNQKANQDEDIKADNERIEKLKNLLSSISSSTSYEDVEKEIFKLRDDYTFVLDDDQ